MDEERGKSKSPKSKIKMLTKRKHYCISILWIVWVCLFLPSLASQTLHFIVVGATNDDEPTIREGIQLTISTVQKEVELIKKNTKLEVKTYTHTAYDFQSEKLRQTINDIYCGSDDVILFYYEGHGFRYRNQNDKWPILAVGYNINSVQDAYHDGIPLSEIIKPLQNKGARLVLIIADCCNSETSYQAPVDQEIRGQASLSFSIRIPDRFKELYEHSSGTIVVSSSVPGQVSRMTKTYGSYFTSSFVELHKELTSISSNANWNDILKKSKERTIQIARINDHEQTPQFEINVNTIHHTPGQNWDGIINSSRGAFNATPNNFQNNNNYNRLQYPIARIVMFSTNRVYFLMSDNFMVEHNPYSGLIIRGYRAFSMQPQMFQWDMVNPVSPYQSIVFGVDYYGKIWSFDNYYGWQNVGIVYY